jgi:hypothetical protein
MYQMSDFEKEDQEIQAELPKDLQDSYNAAKALSIVHGLLHEGSFPQKFHHSVDISIKFITILHQSVVNEALNFPGIEKAEELRLELEKAKL